MSEISQKLGLKQSQNLVMTPQLQQAIKLLQLNNLEIADFIEEEIETVEEQIEVDVPVVELETIVEQN